MRRDNRGISDPQAHACWPHRCRCDGYALVPCWCKYVAAADRPWPVGWRRMNRNPFVHGYLLRELWAYGTPAAPAVGPVPPPLGRAGARRTETWIGGVFSAPASAAGVTEQQGQECSRQGRET